MKYKKGTFVTVPNIQLLDGKPMGYQSLFMWLCKYSDDDGVCYPSRKKLASNLGVVMKTVDKYLAEMEADGILTKTKRRKEGDVTNKSNLYQILLPSQGVENSEPEVTSYSEQGVEKDTVTVSSINSIQLTPSGKTAALEVLPFSWDYEFEKMRGGSSKMFKIIALYWFTKGLEFTNLEQFKSARSREFRPAKSLLGYSSDEISTSMAYCKSNYVVWSLETVAKRIADLVNKK